MSATQKAQLQAQVETAMKGIDWQKINWGQLAALVAAIIQSILASQPQTMQGKAPAQCSHEECCLAAVEATGKAFEAALHCYNSCGPTPSA